MNSGLKRGLKRFVCVPLCFFMSILLTCALFPSMRTAQADDATDVSAIVNAMSLDEKISQMIMPCAREWDKVAVTNLGETPALAEALRKHQYCGVILFGSNVTGTEQTVRLVSDLQQNNAQGTFSTKVPYLIAADQEGGTVARITMGTRGTGSMALGATAANGEKNSRTTGRIFGEELSALGINTNFGPCVDVITNPNYGMNTRVFSDDSSVNGSLSLAFSQGIAESNVITTFKHFPGAGDGNDDPTAIHMSLDQLRSEGLASYKTVIDGGCDLIMISAITLPDIDTPQTLADGTTGYYPASMSPKIVGEMLRSEMGYDGVVVTDALEMEQFNKEPETGAAFVAGTPGAGTTRPNVEYAANIAEKCIVAGCDILLMPTDLLDTSAADFYDAYIDALKAKVDNGTISLDLVNKAVTRILTLKQKYGILSMDTSGSDVDAKVSAAQSVVGIEQHHTDELNIAREAITLLKNDGATLPIDGTGKSVVILGRTAAELTVPAYAIQMLQDEGVIDKDAYVNNVATGTSSGSPDSPTKITLDYYANNASEPHYADPEEAKATLANADVVACFSVVWGLSSMQPTSAYHRGIVNALQDAHETGAKFVLLSGNLPYDAARYQDSDAIVLSYTSSGMNVDPTLVDGNAGAYNTNAIAAIEVLFGKIAPEGKLPSHIPELVESEDGNVAYNLEANAYEPGAGMTYFSQVNVEVGDAGTYTAIAKEPAVTVTIGDTTLQQGTDFTVAYANNVNAGTATATVTGMGSYKGEKTQPFEIAPADVANATISTVASEPYTGAPITPSVSVTMAFTDDGVVASAEDTESATRTVTLKQDVDYDVAYADNQEPGTASIIVTGKGNYTGANGTKFEIRRASSDGGGSNNNGGGSNSGGNTSKPTESKSTTARTSSVPTTADTLPGATVILALACLGASALVLAKSTKS